MGAVVVFVALDVLFKLLIVPAYAKVTADGGADALRIGFTGGVVGLVAWAAALLVLTRPLSVARRLGGELDAGAVPCAVARERVAAAIDAVHRTPTRLALVWTIDWLVFVAVLSLRTGPTWTVFFFLVAMALGPFPLAHALAVWWSSPAVRELSVAARRAGALPTRRGDGASLRARVAAYGLCMSLAPTSYMAAVAAEGRADLSSIIVTIGVFLVGVTAYGLLCAALLTSALLEPIEDMRTLVGAITKQGNLARIGRLPLYVRDEAGELAEMVNEMVDRLEHAEAGWTQAAELLGELNESLERRVEERTTELGARTEAMRLVLDNVEQALFTIDGDGMMAGGHSAALERWFGAPASSDRFWTYLGRSAPAFGEATEAAFDQVRGGLLPVEVSLAQMPARLTVGDRTYEVVYTSIGAADRFLVVVSDVSARVESERLRRERSETLALFEAALADRAGVASFLGEGERQLACAVTCSAAGTPDARRALHTLKGNANLLGVESLAEICHAIETRLADGDDLRGELDRLVHRWSSIRADLERLLGAGQRAIEVPREELEALATSVRAGTPRSEIARLLEDLEREPVERRLRHLAAKATRIAERLDKAVRTEVVHDGVRVDAGRFEKLWSAAVHAVTNAVDHGIEPPDERERQGKPREGRVSFRAARRSDGFVLEIEDDGRGIPWDALRARSEANGIPVATEADVVAAMFVEGVSTTTTVTSFSGRGVGMGALRAAVEELAGSIDVRSERGRGTTIRVIVPTPQRPVAACA